VVSYGGSADTADVGARASDPLVDAPALEACKALINYIANDYVTEPEATRGVRILLYKT
jgi:hypothetical protein